MGQVQFVTDLKESLDKIGGRGGGGGPKNGNWDKKDFLEGARWGYRIKKGDIPSGLMQTLTEDEGSGEPPPQVIFVERPDKVRNRRESPPEHKEHYIE